jgi:hypothetical protein
MRHVEGRLCGSFWGDIGTDDARRPHRLRFELTGGQGIRSMDQSRRSRSHRVGPGMHWLVSSLSQNSIDEAAVAAGALYASDVLD